VERIDDPDRILAAVLGNVEETVGAPGSFFELRFQEEPTAIQDGDTIVLHFPGVRLDGGYEGEAWIIGDVTMHVVPQDEAGFYAVVVDVPEQIRFLDKYGELVGNITFRTPRLSGVWWARIANFVTLDAGFDAFAFTVTDNLAIGGRLTTGPVMITQDYVEKPLAQHLSVPMPANSWGGSGLWNGVAYVSVAGLKLVAGAQVDRFNVECDRLSASMSATDFELDALATLFDEYNRDLDMAGGSLNSEAAEALAERVAGMGWGAGQAQIELDGFRTWALLKPTFTAEHMALRFRYDSMKALGSVGLSLDFASTETPWHEIVDFDLPPELVPHTASLDIGVVGLPLRHLIGIMAADLLALLDVEGMEDPDDSENMMDEDSIVGSQMMDVFESYTPEVHLETLSLVSDALRIAGAGGMTLTPVSHGLFRLEIQGLDRAMELIGQRAETDPEMQGLQAVLLMLRGLGKPVVGDDGESIVYTYKIEIDSLEDVKINDTSLSTIMGGD